MHSFTSLAMLGFATFAGAHMVMSSPKPFANGLNNSPLDASGSDFPCKKRTGTNATTGATVDVTYDASSISGGTNAMALGSTQHLAFIGSAAHGGGSCQVSITYDLNPTSSSVWKVIHSIEGGCPVTNTAGNLGNDASMIAPDTYSFTIPTNLPTGKAVLAWTWFNKVGNREMYMNCAPVALSSTTAKRAVEIKRDSTAYNALPNMFTANIGNGCTTQDSKDVIFPNPGDSVDQLGGSTKAAALATPTGTGCGAVVAAATSAGSGTSPSTYAASKPSSSVVAGVAPSSVKASLGGVFATVAPFSAAAPAVATSLSPVASTASTLVPVASVVASSVAIAPVAVTTKAASSAAPVISSSPAASGASSTSSTTLTGTCATEGMWNCIGGAAFQRCASGTWSVVVPMAAGTSCGTSGLVTNINIIAIPLTKPRRRSANAHLKNHLHRSS